MNSQMAGTCVILRSGVGVENSHSVPHIGMQLTEADNHGNAAMVTAILVTIYNYQRALATLVPYLSLYKGRTTFCALFCIILGDPGQQ